jgi:hypothetical protein
MVLNQISEFWKTNEGTAVVVLGLLVGLMIWTLGLGRGFEQGFDLGIQAMETGQVVIHSTNGGFDQYFLLRSLIEGLPGVDATSARLDFQAKVTNNKDLCLARTGNCFSRLGHSPVYPWSPRIGNERRCPVGARGQRGCLDRGPKRRLQKLRSRFKELE